MTSCTVWWSGTQCIRSQKIVILTRLNVSCDSRARWTMFDVFVAPRNCAVGGVACWSVFPIENISERPTGLIAMRRLATCQQGIRDDVAFRGKAGVLERQRRLFARGRSRSLSLAVRSGGLCRHRTRLTSVPDMSHPTSPQHPDFHQKPHVLSERTSITTDDRH
jgi:hypothetical protein